ncbi:Alpha-(1,3)-fucosyltransferase 6 [Holothuria leucospilota]|uniref:Fucosyltransferase n=1 Tax=Holothuria leucospilota TaxID=206669 RepID=A0A9Q0YDB3_HOLLE|nr:Alpha-(1,3)-fucosyltransferase 6 [Holothuria leucospilota]
MQQRRFVVLSIFTVIVTLAFIILTQEDDFAIIISEKGLLRQNESIPHFFHNEEDVKYEFLAYKKKPGWHFVKYPCNYQCNVSGVEVTVNYSTNPSDITGKDVVLFRTGPFELHEWEELQYYRTPGQIWIFVTQEPASIVPRLLPPKIYRHTTYNWSFTFHSTSDIYGAYGWYTPFSTKTTSSKLIRNWYQEKSEFAAWISSRHCEGLGWDRTRFVLDLRKHVPIDMYGKCGNLSLSRNDSMAEKVIQKYKFHLSLENSCCSEYLSEKFWNALQNWKSVPIVIGGTKEEYVRLAPPNSFIHADDFPSIEALARHLHTVATNEKVFNSYFEWHQKGTVDQLSFRFRHPVFKEGACKVVEKLQQLHTKYSEYTFDPYSTSWFGSCYKCGEHHWIQRYNFLWKRTIFQDDWQDNRTLYLLDGK